MQKVKSSAMDPTIVGVAPNQFGAICWRLRREKVEVLLITSRDTGRWIVPKGWAIPDIGPAGTAQTEAWEEAGILGEVSQNALGQFEYNKFLRPGAAVRCKVEVFGIRVKEVKDKFPERKERGRKWFAASKAARKVWEPELRDLLKSLDALLFPKT
jgi:8-oxo-dGTP pyrophosphatase MutT (NUDIX family)